MGLFDIFKRSDKSKKQNKLASMRCKMVNYEYIDFAELCSQMDNSAEFIVKLKPANYYALKSEYIEAAYYSNDDYTENYVIFRVIKNDRPVLAANEYPVSQEILRKAFTKLGAVNF